MRLKCRRCGKRGETRRCVKCGALHQIIVESRGWVGEVDVVTRNFRRWWKRRGQCVTN